MDEKKVVRLLRAVARLDEAEAQQRRVKERAACIPLARFRTALLAGDWAPEERGHWRSCPRCQRVESRVRPHLWHPSLKEIWAFLRGRLWGDALQDVQDHLWRDGCRRCRWVGSVLGFLTGETDFGRGSIVLKPPIYALMVFPRGVLPYISLEEAPPVPPSEELPQPFELERAEFAFKISPYGVRRVPFMRTRMESEPMGVVTEAPVSLTEASVVLKGPDMEVQWLREPEGWVVRARTRRPPDKKAWVRFSLADPQGTERWHVEVPLRSGRGRWWTAEARMPFLEDVSEAYLMALVVPSGLRRSGL